MKLNPDFITHVTKGEHYMISTGDSRFNGIVKLNGSAAFIIECLKNDTTEDEIIDKVIDKYSEAYRNDVAKDVSESISKLRSIGAILE